MEVSNQPCEECGGPVELGAYLAACRKCDPNSFLPCAWCDVTFIWCRCDGAGSWTRKKLKEGWRPANWEKTAQGAQEKETPPLPKHYDCPYCDRTDQHRHVKGSV
jgi:hypothetical protein